MNEIMYIELEKIHPNPFQTREKEDAEHVAKIAASIEVEGLLQIPVARPKMDTGGMELAFGHTRLAAFKKLAAEHPEDERWKKMPVTVRDLADEDMFRLAVSENLARKDLNAIEEARAMAVYRDHFKKNSAEIGALFGLSDSAVRNKMRLLDLPETVQAAVESGDLPEGVARRVLSLQAVAPEKVAEVTEKLTSGGYETAENINSVVASAIVENRERFCMWNRWKSDPPRGGDGLWKLSDVVKRPEGYFWISDNEKTWGNWSKELNASPCNYTGYVNLISSIGQWLENVDADEVADYFKVPLLLVHQIEALATLQACTKCPLYVKLDGSHYCGLKACWERKRKAFYQEELERISKKMGVAIYDKKADGEKLIAGEGYYDPRAADSYTRLELPWKKWIEEKAEHLRVAVHYNNYNANQFTENWCAALAWVGPEAKEYYEGQRNRTALRAEKELNQAQRWQEERRRRDESEKFIRAVAGPVFAQVFEPLESLGLLRLMLGRELGADEGSRAEKLQICRRALAVDFLGKWLGWKTREEGVMATAEFLQGVAKEIGLVLPADWLEQAKGFEAGGV